ncbi:MAG: trypsin-like peptidase domain-containing protein [Ruminococcus sp.]|nr:trypsin-like peptidase domain-containing protein [Ruminococcus sp.]
MKKMIIAMACAVIVAGVLLAGFFVLPILHENDCKNRVFDDLNTRLGEVSGAVIGIIPRTEQNGAVTYGGGGSGFVFEEKDGVYYALTAAHVVSDKKAVYKCCNTKKAVETLSDPAIKAAGMTVVDDSFYESLDDVTVEYVSPHADIAIVSFKSEQELICLKLAERDPAKDDRLMCLGLLDDRLLSATYGTVTAGLTTATIDSEKSDNVVEHDAYLTHGNSGGPAVNEGLTAAGMNVGGEYDRFEHFKYGYLIPASQLKICINDWNASRQS